MEKRQSAASVKSRSGLALVMEGTIRIAPLLAIPPLLREMGQDPAEVVTEAGLDLAMFDDPETTVSFVDASRLLGVCGARTGCEHFGLLVGQRAGIESLGVVGLLMQQAPDVGTALRDVVLHLQVHDRGAIPTLVAEDGMVELGYSVYQKGAKNTGQIYDIAMAMALNLMKSLCGADWLPSQVLFRHTEPTDRGPYRRLFKVPLRFDCDHSALVFPLACLGHPVTGANPVLRRILEAEIEALMERIDMDFVAHFRRVLSGLVITSRATSEQAAFLFGFHRRTLNRRLKAKGTSFQRLLDEARCEIAQQLLGSTQMPITEISAALGYAENSVFTRAFRRWAGTTPAAWRAETKQQASARAAEEGLRPT
ncbi:MAG: hypothetical protein H6R26_3156 [Proteobacteria bacterium]|nr:hypothetical protein [Pseudomonadota bacterium]